MTKLFFVGLVVFLGFFSERAAANDHAIYVGAALERPPEMEMKDYDDLPFEEKYEVSRGDLEDPLEPFNRLMFMINDFADTLVFNPMANLYKTFLPDFVQTGVSNALSNLSEPLRFANCVLQGKIDDAFETLGRFIVNSTLGILGLFDVASDIGLEKHVEDFGQTLASWGITAGPYLVLPILGPSSFRDAIGQGVDTFADPVNYIARCHRKKQYIIIRWSAEAISRRALYIDEIDSLKETSIDFYATIRTLYHQRRQHLIRDGAAPETPDEPDPDDYDEAFE